MIRVGLVGFGKWGKNYAKLLSGPGVTISKICRRNINNLPVELTNQYRFTDNIDETIYDSDALIIATGPDVRVQYAKLALLAKKPVLLEKPISLNFKEVEELYQLSRQTRTPILVDNIHLFNYPFLELRKSSQFSRIRSIECEISNNGPFRDFNTLFDYGPHPLSMCLSIVNDPENWKIMDVERIRNGVGELYHIKMKFENTLVSLTFGNDSTIKSCYFRTTHSDKKILMYDDLSAVSFTKNGVPVYIDKSEPLTELVNFWIKSIKISEFDDWRYNEILNLTIYRILNDIQNLVNSLIE